MKYFWIVNEKFKKIYKCYKINENEYRVEFVFNFNFDITGRYYKSVFDYNIIGKGVGLNIMYDKESVMFDNRQELDNYMLLTSL